MFGLYPNISGTIRMTGAGSTQSNISGALYSHGNETSGGQNHTLGNEDSAKTVGFSASRSGSIYGDSTTVQPPAIRVLPLIKT